MDKQISSPVLYRSSAKVILSCYYPLIVSVSDFIAGKKKPRDNSQGFIYRLFIIILYPKMDNDNR